MTGGTDCPPAGGTFSRAQNERKKNNSPRPLVYLDSGRLRETERERERGRERERLTGQLAVHNVNVAF